MLMWGVWLACEKWKYLKYIGIKLTGLDARLNIKFKWEGSVKDDFLLSGFNNEGDVKPLSVNGTHERAVRISYFQF